MNFDISYDRQYESEFPVLRFYHKYIDILIKCSNDIDEFLNELEEFAAEEENYCISYKSLYIHRIYGGYIVISNSSELYDKYSPENSSYWEFGVKPKVVTKLINALKNGPNTIRW